MRKLLTLFFVAFCFSMPALVAQPEDDDLTRDLEDELGRFDESEAAMIIQRLVVDDEADQGKSIEALKSENEQIATMRQNALSEKDVIAQAIEDLKLHETNLQGESDDLQDRSQRALSENKRLAEDAEDVSESDDMATAEDETRYQGTSSAINANESLIASNEQAISGNEAAISALQQQMEEFEAQIETLNELIDQCDAVIISNQALIKAREEQKD